MSVDEQLAALPEGVRAHLWGLVRVVGGLSQKEKEGLLRALHTTQQKRVHDNWTGDVLGAFKGVIASMMVAAFPPPERFTELFTQIAADKENDNG